MQKCPQAQTRRADNGLNPNNGAGLQGVLKKQGFN